MVLDAKVKPSLGGTAFMKTSISTSCLSGAFTEKLEAITRAGFDGVEIYAPDLVACDLSAKDIGDMIRDHGLALTAFQPFPDLEGLPEPLRSQAFDRAERKFDIMQNLGADLLILCSNVLPEAQGGVDRAAADIRALGERAATRGIRLGFEPLAWGRFVKDHRDAWEIVRRVDLPNVGVVLDSFHSLARGVDLDSIRSIPKEKLFLVQLCDAPKLDLDTQSWSRRFRNLPGQGDLPVFEFMQAVEATGYDGFVSLEIFNDPFRNGSTRTFAVDGKRSLINLADRMAAAAPERHPASDKLPPRANCHGVEFIEFAIDDARATKLVGFLRALGFEKYGQHKSKRVTVWRQGEVKLVVNSEPESFARTFYHSHGPSVCAICLRVDDAQAAVERASRLLAVPFMQSIVNGELEIPAILGVENSLIYFIDAKSELASLWTNDFNIWENAPNILDAGIEKIDHIAQSTRFDELLSWVLFYTSLLNLKKLPGQDIADPAGLVWSQVVQSDDGAFRIALNGAQSLRTQSGRFVNEFFGSGTQHIAFATSDILATAKKLVENGLKPITIPGNYYYDLIARYQLDESFVAELAAYSVMYDRDEAGEYFQIYTETFEDRFFFEIVERRGYAGFGASNAPVRLAAQARVSRDAAAPNH